MTQDARFEDGREAPLNLGALDGDDLAVIASLAQDAVFPASEMRWHRKGARFALLLNRVRWEDEGQSDHTRARHAPARHAPARHAPARHAPERVQSVLMFNNVHAVASQGVPKADADTILSLLDISFDETDAPSGSITLTLAGDGAIRLEVEALEVTLKDVTKPYAAPSKKLPIHPE